MQKMEATPEPEFLDDDFLFYSLLYSSITIVFAMAVLSRFLTNEFRFGFRSFLSLIIVFLGEPTCHFMVRGAMGVAIFGLGCLFVYSILPAGHLPAPDKAVLITGCDSGFGNALAKKLDSIGMTVFAGCLFQDGPGAIELRNNCSTKLKVVQLDVTDDSQINDATKYVTEQLHGQGLWGLVNNAGIWHLAEIEMTPEKIWRRVLEVNLFGMIRVTKSFLPLVRQAKGRVVNMSSVTGKVPMEGMGVYAVSKHGIEAFSDTLRLEMAKWQVQVSVIEPSGFLTDAMRSHVIRQKKEEIWDNLDELTKQTYGEEYLRKMYESFESMIPRCPKDLTPVVRAIRAALLSKRPREKYPLGFGAGSLLCVFPFLPVFLADRISYMLGVTPRDILPLALKK